MKNRKTIRWGLAGLGAQGERLACAMKAAKQQLVAVTGHDPKHTRIFARKFGADIYSWNEMLEDKNIDAICIATPNNQHAKQAIAAFAAGKAVLCEKPLALTLAEGERIERAAKKSNKKSAVVFHLRTHPAILAARDMIRKGKLGEIRLIEMQWSVGSGRKFPSLPKYKMWRENVVKAGGGALVARGVHLFDLLRFLTGKEMTSVKAYMDAPIDRTTVGVLSFGKIPAVVLTSKHLPNATNGVIIHGSKARIILRDTFLSEERASLELLSEKGMIVRRFPKMGLFGEVFRAFPRSKNQLATIEDGVAVIKITEAWKKSAGVSAR